MVGSSSLGDAHDGDKLQLLNWLGESTDWQCGFDWYGREYDVATNGF